MTPERWKELRNYTSPGSGVWECLDEIQRLQSPLPDGLEKRLVGIEEIANDSNYDIQHLARSGLLWLCSTIRALQAELQKERERPCPFCGTDQEKP